VGKLPALGWNSWNAYGCNIDESKMMAAANQMVSLGLKAAGYQYVNIDVGYITSYTYTRADAQAGLLVESQP
jgi:hypothetical protein